MGANSVTHWIIVAAIILGVGFLVMKGAKSKPASSRGSSSGVRFRNPANGYEEEISNAGLWCLLFGCVYFAVKGVWTHAVAAFVLAVLTVGLSWLIYPFFARRILETHYLRKGWVAVGATATS
ncbi:MAG: hypothetical protein AB7M05_08615 [Alphaproteobacteria bacterium]